MNKVKYLKNVKKITVLLSFITIVLVIIQVLSYKKFDKKNNNRLNIDKIIEEINISEYRIKSIFEENIKQRTIKNSGYQVFIGETDKQIENGYYDVKAYIQDNKCIVIYLNKLWKEFDERMYEEDYIAEVTESIKEILDINVPLNEIYDYVLAGYLAAKNVGMSSYDKKEDILDLNEYVIKGKVLEKEYVMSIYKK